MQYSGTIGKGLQVDSTQLLKH